MVTAARRAAPAGIALGAALVLIAVNLRLAVGSVSPVLDDIRDQLGLSGTAAGLLTTAPVLCFGLAAPLAPRLARRHGQEVLLLWSLAAVVTGLLVRIVPAVAPLFLGTIVLGIGIAVANVLMPSVIKRRFENPGVMMGLYTMSLSLSAATAALLTVPLEHGLGSWRWALAFWAIPAVLGMLVWAPDVRRSGRTASEGTGVSVSVRRDPVAQMVTAAFALQSLLFFAFVSWLPDVLRDAGLSSATAGAWLSLSMVCGIPISILLPVFMTRRRDQRWLGTISPVLWGLGLLGVLLDPAGLTWLWMVLTGVAQGGGIAYVLTLVVVRAPDGTHAAALSGMSQGVGYSLGATGPVAVGAMYDATGGWEVPLGVLFLGSIAFLVTAVLAGRDRLVRGHGIPPSRGS